MLRAQGDGRCLGPALALLVACATSGLYAQQDTWQWSPSQKYHDATVKIWQDHYTGSGVLIGTNKSKTLGYVLTAAHVVKKGEYAGVEWEDKTRSAGKVVLVDEAIDLAIVTCDPPDDAIVARVARDLPGQGEVCDHTGWGGDEPIELRSFYGHYMHTEGSGTFTNTSAIVGDSGGGVWFDGQLIGIIQGGKYKIVNGEELNFPARSATLESVQNMCSRISQMPSEEILQAARGQVPPNYFQFLGEGVHVEVQPDQIDVTVTPNGVPVPTPPEVVVEKPDPPAPAQPAAQPDPQPVAQAPAQTVLQMPQVVSIDTGMIAKAVVQHITQHDLLPPVKVDDAEVIIRISERLRKDDEFANLVAAKIMDKIEAKVLKRISEAIAPK